MTALAVTIAQQKGGAGKTTLAAQLAVTWSHSGHRVVMVDVDPQGSLSAWYRLRQEILGEEAGGLHLVEVAGWKLSTELDRLRGKYDMVVIDSPPHAETDARVAVRAADVVVVPVQPSPMDLWATRPTLDMAQKEKAAAVLVLNRMPPRGRLSDVVRSKLAELNVPLANSQIGNRMAFAASMMEGKGVVETHARDTAAAEIQALALEIMGRLRNAA
ncbi:ParA family partition ATPase [Telmatospirillum sp. J64-1]|uniref:ParA family partition ATPase n=1 Tax=Telmatospirillum sp. J64-1 TaxID=2502183 RepID=UPI00115EB720|nr:ParA family partition ATPase [Telmatospirillum sp. J64-1]